MERKEDSELMHKRVNTDGLGGGGRCGWFLFACNSVFLLVSFIKIIIRHRITIKLASKVPSVIYPSPSPIHLFFFFLNTKGVFFAHSSARCFLSVVASSNVCLEALPLHKEFPHSFFMAASYHIHCMDES